MSNITPSRPKSQSNLPATSQLLTMGGDRRITLDSATGVNKYLCPPSPDPSLLGYGSATASTIAPAAFAAAEELRQRLEKRAGVEPPSATYAHELQRIRQEFYRLFGWNAHNGPDIIFASSGTDAHLFAAQLAGEAAASPLLILMMEAAETGSGVPKALEGKHFSDCTVSGSSVVSGTAIDGAYVTQVMALHSRHADGTLRPAAAMDADLETRVTKAVADGWKVLVILADVSKTGLIAPSPACVTDLRRRFPAKVEVLVDACQLRLAPATLRAYLQLEFPVAVTGSKFSGGPAFSGALLVPKPVSQRWRKHTMPSALAAYSTRPDWPEGWEAQNVLPDAANYGLLLRWQAALTEMQAFYFLPEATIEHFLKTFAAAIHKRFAQDPVFEPLAVAALDRQGIITAKSWDLLPTIFPFMLRRSNGVHLNRDEMRQIYKRLNEQHCQLGQPVLCGVRDGVPVSALRLCLSARLIVDAVSPQGRGENAITIEALSLLDKTAELTRQLS